MLAKRLEYHPATLKPLPLLHEEPGDAGIPSLRLSGKWLEEIGFAIGAKVRIEVEAGVLKLAVVLAKSIKFSLE